LTNNVRTQRQTHTITSDIRYICSGSNQSQKGRCFPIKNSLWCSQCKYNRWYCATYWTTKGIMSHQN